MAPFCFYTIIWTLPDFDGKATKQQKNKKRASALVNYVIKHASKKNKPIQVFYKKFAGCSVYLGVELNAKANDSSDRLKKQSLGGKRKRRACQLVEHILSVFLLLAMYSEVH